MTEEERAKNKAGFRDRINDWGRLKIPSAEDGATFEAHGRTWTIVRLASGPTAPKSHVVGITDGGGAKLYARCTCLEPGDEVLVIDIVTESFWRVCSKCRCRTPGDITPGEVLSELRYPDHPED
jgi:hypothetical protein